MQQKASSSHKAARFIGRVFALLGVTLSVVLLAAVGCVAVLCKGPSVTARALFVTTVSQNKITAMVPRLFLSAKEIETIAAQNTVLPVAAVSEPFVFEKQQGAVLPVQTQKISGSTYAGTLVLVADPSRVSVAAAPFGETAAGMSLAEFTAQTQAELAVAGGTAVSAGMPEGLVFAGGKKLQGNDTITTYTVAAFDAGHRLLVGQLTGMQAAERGVRDAVSCRAALIVNGKAAEVLGTGGGLYRCTAIGQRADGTVLLLTLAGKEWWQPGATYQDCLAVMKQNGAVNAAVLNDTLFTSRQRNMPTAVIVK